MPKRSLRSRMSSASCDFTDFTVQKIRVVVYVSSIIPRHFSQSTLVHHLQLSVYKPLPLPMRTDVINEWPFILSYDFILQKISNELILKLDSIPYVSLLLYTYILQRNPFLPAISKIHLKCKLNYVNPRSSKKAGTLYPFFKILNEG